MNTKVLLRPNLDKIGFTILLFLLTSFFFVLFTEPETVRAVWLLVLIPSYVISSLLYKALTKHSLTLKVLRWVVFTPIIFLVIICFVSEFAPDKPPEDFLIKLINLSLICISAEL